MLASYATPLPSMAAPEIMSPGCMSEPTPTTRLTEATASMGADHVNPTKLRRRPSKWRSVKKPIAAITVLVLMATVTVMMLRLAKTDQFSDAIEWIQENKTVGAAIYMACFVLCIVLCFPSTAFELLAGYIFGFWLGLLLASVGKLTGSVFAFIIGRYMCRRRVKMYMERGHPVFHAFRALLLRRQVLIVFLTRTAFFPIAMKNYGLSVLDVSFVVYFLAALLTGFPFSIIWVYSGHAAQHLTTLLSNPKSQNKTEVIILIVGASSALLLLFFVGYYTRKHILALAEEEATSKKLNRHPRDSNPASTLGVQTDADSDDDDFEDEIQNQAVTRPLQQQFRGGQGINSSGDSTEKDAGAVLV